MIETPTQAEIDTIEFSERFFLGIGMKKRERTFLFNKTDALWRLTLLNTATRIFPSLIVTEFPKSGGTWLCQMLADCIDLPYPRNQLPAFGPNIYQGHYLKRYPGRTLVQWRDPRDIIVSLYHFLYFKTDFVSEARVASSRAHAGFRDFDDVEGNLPEFIELIFTDPRIPRFSWNSFFDKWTSEADVVHTSYERLRQNGIGELSRITAALGGAPDQGKIAETVDRHSFQRVSGRKVGEEDRNSFVRKGVVGDWVNVFSPHAIDRIQTLTAGRLERYERFVSSLPNL